MRTCKWFRLLPAGTESHSETPPSLARAREVHSIIGGYEEPTHKKELSASQHEAFMEPRVPKTAQPLGRLAGLTAAIEPFPCPMEVALPHCKGCLLIETEDGWFLVSSDSKSSPSLVFVT